MSDGLSRSNISFALDQRIGISRRLEVGIVMRIRLAKTCRNVTISAAVAVPRKIPSYTILSLRIRKAFPS
jgi:hypothetical protein